MKTSWRREKAELDDSLALGMNWGEKKEFIKAFGEPEAQWVPTDMCWEKRGQLGATW